MRKSWIVLAILSLSLLLTGAGKDAVFSDVPPDSWCGEDVAQMARSGLLSGYSDGTFRPDQPITAAQFVTVTARCAKLTPGRGQTGHWAAGQLQAALEAGWYDWDELPPTGERYDQPIPRQLAVKILMRALLPEARGDYLTESRKIKDFAQLEGRYYEPVLAAYAQGIAAGDAAGNFRPTGSLTRAQACALIRRALRKSGASAQGPSEPPPQTTPAQTPLAQTAVQGGVSQNGWLQVRGAQLCNAAGAPVVLRGMSSHGLQWYGGFASAQAIRNTADRGANVFRIAMYTAEGGYLGQPEAMRQKVIAAADAAIANDLYVIIDWHILSDGNPKTHEEEAAAFFSGIAARYKDSPAVLYEICNEPNGGVSWQRDIKPYAERLVKTIRAQSPRSVILIGSGTWSQDIHQAAADPLKGENLMYTLHFYAGTHGADLRARLDAALSAGLPVFVSEWGVSRADGSGGVFLKEAGEWLDFLDARGVSWCNWSLCDKDETSAALRPGVGPDRVWTDADLTDSGRFVFSRFSP